MIGRPEKDEAVEFHWNYINQVAGDDPVAAMAAQLDEIEALLAGMPEERSLYRYAEGKWSIRETVNHITDTERIFAFRALWFARGLGDALPGFDQDVAVAAAGADKLSLAAHLDEFREVRAATLALFQHLPEETWLRSGMMSGKMVTVRALAFLVAGHAAHHLRILRERYLA